MNPEEREQAQRLARLYAAEAVAELKDAGVLQPAPSLLEHTYRDLVLHVRQAYALAWLLDQLNPIWAAHPDMRLSDRLKTERPERLAYLAAELGKVGITGLLPDEVGPDD